ncbi:hypothetical protein JXB37_06910 [candidate division WOR-3 bacterium]|nr:hypothetical protein [candidate division WOR-3 bacterium]
MRTTLAGLALLLMLGGCPGPEAKPDYFPLVPGARRWMEVHTRTITGSDTSETTEVRLVSRVHGEQEIPEQGKLWVIETPRDSGPAMLSYFRKSDTAVVQLVPMRDRPALEKLYLSLPLEKGKGWQDSPARREMFEVVAQETVTVKGGVFPDCFKVAIISTGVDWAMHEWYAAGVGSVKWESRAAWTRDSVNYEQVRTAELVRYELPAE